MFADDAWNCLDDLLMYELRRVEEWKLRGRKEPLVFVKQFIFGAKH